MISRTLVSYQMPIPVLQQVHFSTSESRYLVPTMTIFPPSSLHPQSPRSCLSSVGKHSRSLTSTSSYGIHNFAMTCFSTPVYSSGQPSVGGNETWQIDIGELSFRSFKRDVHASHLISMADLAPPLVRVSKFHSRMETRLSFYHLP